MIGDLVRNFRIKRNISQQELAFRSNLCQCQISRIENNSRKVDVYELQKLATALDVSLEDLIEKEC